MDGLLLMLVLNCHRYLLAINHYRLDQCTISIIQFHLFDVNARSFYKILQNFLLPNVLLTNVEIPHRTSRVHRLVRNKVNGEENKNKKKETQEDFVQ